MRIKDLGTRPVPASIRELFTRLGRGHGPAVAVPRRPNPYWQQRGWIQTGNQYKGTYQTPYAAFQGWIELHRSGQSDFFIYCPSEEIRQHSHWTCFQHRGNDWYLVHMAKEPRDVSSGIMTIERLIMEAYEQ